MQRLLWTDARVSLGLSRLASPLPIAPSSTTWSQLQCRQAGHSKWAKIHRAKGANDAAKGLIFSKMAKQIGAAVKAGGTDPASNQRLANALAAAKKCGTPKDVVERAMKSKSDIVLEQITYEGTGPCGVAFIVECLTDNKKRSVGIWIMTSRVDVVDDRGRRHGAIRAPSYACACADLRLPDPRALLSRLQAQTIRHLFTKSGGELAAAGSSAWCFKQVGQVTVSMSAPESGDSGAAAAAKPSDAAISAWNDEVMEAALNGGADDVQYADKDEEDSAAVHSAIVSCSKESVAEVKTALEVAGLHVESSEVARIPTTFATVEGEDDEEKFANMLDALENHEDVQDFVHNAGP